ncbi:KH domain-containing protein [Candidatus Peregrinibacteria bacterium]|nr:KH domain-containing protein [Candidatus Peregrinibacteria bacterium]
MTTDELTEDLGGDDSASTDDSVASDDPVTTTGDGAQGKDKDFVEFVVKQLVDNPTEVKISRRVDELGVFIMVSVAKEDMGKLIGKNGQTVDALRVLLRVMGAKDNNRVNLKVVEPEEM